MPSWLRRGVLSLMLLVALAAALGAQGAPQWSGCKMDSLATYNCAQYYNGTVSLNSELKGADLHQSFRVVATVTGGRVNCQVKGTEVGDFAGPGMLAVEHESNMNAGGYSISVWCPQEAGKRPKRGDSPIITVSDQRASDYGVLDGKDSYDHPDADPANGLSGTETVTWALRRQ
jgi:hypothetical protein